VVEAYEGESATFHGAGREDVDALMLGTGRPFVIEVEDPHTRGVDPDRLQAEINEYAEGKAEVTDIVIPTYDMVERVKEHDASKTYRMAVEFDDPVGEDELQDALSELRGATITQRTPQRVDHRRADIDRTRMVYEIGGELDDETHATV
jgi:tRNA pseudouridine synthase 10